MRLIQPKLSVGPADDEYEREAHAVADRVARSLGPTTRHRDEAGTVQPPPGPKGGLLQAKAFTTGSDIFIGSGEPTATAPGAVRHAQRIMSGKEWYDAETTSGLSVLKSDTRTVFASKRNKVLTIDTAMNDLKAIGDYSRYKPEVADARVEGLQKIIQACDGYLALDAKKAKRQAAVQALKDQAVAELDLLRRVIAARDEANLKTKIDALLALQREAIATTGTLKTSAIGTYAMDLVAEAAQHHDAADRPTLEALVKKDAAQLEAVQDDPDAPQIVKDIIAEALGHIELVHLGAFHAAGARVPNEKELAEGVETKYVVNHKLGVPLGEPERLASLMHELTHVVAGETYQNTIMFLLFDPEAPDSAVVELARKRHEELNNLLELAEAAAQKQVIDGDQLLLLKDKIGYGGTGSQGDKLKTYLGNFKKSLPEETHAKLTALEKQLSGFSSTVVEFDSVVNQVVTLAYQWGLPKDDPFYATAQRLATEAKQMRDEHRAAMLANTQKAEATVEAGAKGV